jgi:metal-responsive CopG/Arc/MetJ family transcriptional regulator
MKTRNKVAISLPRETFVALEKKRRELKKSRSAVVAEALDAWLAGETLSEEERRYVAGYLANPESNQEAAIWAEVAVWGEWDEA